MKETMVKAHQTHPPEWSGKLKETMVKAHQTHPPEW
jgi:hypothetical protein